MKAVENHNIQYIVQGIKYKYAIFNYETAFYFCYITL